jgi:general stress protein CsbA
MHSTRIATFLLGAWISCCVFMDLMALENLRLASGVLNSAIPPAVVIIQKSSREELGLLLRYFAAEQYRYYFSTWELIQIPVALLLAGVLYIAAEKRRLPQILCGLMLALVLFQLAINPEWAYRGREADFPPGSQTLGTQARVWALTEVWIGAESSKLLIGALLVSYLFTYKSRRRARRASDEFLGTGRSERLSEQV